MSVLLGPRMVCPFCLHPVAKAGQAVSCPACQQPLPPLYLHNARELEPLPVQAIGWQEHGKSVFLLALTLVLTRMQVVWDRYEWWPGNEETRKAIEAINEHLELGSLPGATTLGANVPLLLLLRGMERWEERALVYRDCAGEHFDTLDIPVDQVPFLVKARTLFLIVSPEDLARRRQRTIDMLVQGLLTTLQRNGIDLVRERRRLVVVLTKGDMIRDLPPDLDGYLRTDTVWRTLDRAEPGLQFDEPAIDRYLTRMEKVDRQLREWVQTTAAGRHLVGLATKNGLDLRFCVVSATGGAVYEGKLESRWYPRRMLDPLLWALTFQPPRFSLPAVLQPGARPRGIFAWLQRAARRRRLVATP